MEENKDQNQSSPEKSPSDERRLQRDRSHNLTGGIEDDTTVPAWPSSPMTPTKYRRSVGELENQTAESSGRKRTHCDIDQGGPSPSGGGQKGKRRGELNDPPSTEPKCATCGKIFGSWKAVFGHLRSHPEREYRGAFPPPKMWEEMLRAATAAAAAAVTPAAVQKGKGSTDEQQQELLASTLLSVARDVSSKLCVGGEGEVSESGTRKGLEIDLNNEPRWVHGGSGMDEDTLPFDLNMPPPRSDDDDDDDDKDEGH